MMRWVIVAACLLIVWLPLSHRRSPDPPVPDVPQDLFDEFAGDYRVLLADGWQEFASTDFDSDADALTWINSRNKLAHQAAFAPVNERAAAAAQQGPEFIGRFAEQLRQGKLK